MDDAKIEAVLRCVAAELKLATAWYPTNHHKHAALGEEVGELANALMEHDRGTQGRLDVFSEAMQVAAMAVSIAMGGSEEFCYEYDPDLCRQFLDNLKRRAGDHVGN